MPSGLPLKREVSFLLIQAEPASRVGLIQALGGGDGFMSIRGRAAIRATFATGVWALLMLIPLVSAINLIAFMLPLWIISNLGIPGLGHETNGFFDPSAAGWGLIASFVWLVFFWIFRGRLMRAASAGSAASY